MSWEKRYFPEYWDGKKLAYPPCAKRISKVCQKHQWWETSSSFQAAPVGTDHGQTNSRDILRHKW